MPGTKWWIRGGVAAVLAFVLLIVGYSSVYKSLDVCSVCGKSLITRQVQIPRTHITLFTLRSNGNTPVGTVLDEAKLVPDHEHKWKNVYTIGNGQALMFGPGKRTEGIFSSGEVLNYVQAISGFQSGDKIAKYLAALQLEDTSRNTAVGPELPPAAFVNETLIEDSKRKTGLEDIISGKHDDPKPAH
jgi:hypothetical protein